MTGKDFIRKGVLPVAGFMLVGWLGSYFYIVDGQMDWFRFAMIFGILAGIPHMFVIIPGNLDLGGTAGMIGICILLGGLLGIPIAVWKFVRAVWYFFGFPVSRLYQIAVERRS